MRFSIGRLVIPSILLCLMSIPVFAADQLRITAIPDESPDQLAKKYAPMVQYLKKGLKMDVVYVPASNYDATVEMVATNVVDLVWYGGFTAVQAMKRTGAIPVVQREEDEQFKSEFIAGKDTGIAKLADIKGKNFSFGSLSSTSGHLMPRYYLMKEGFDPEKDFAKVNFSGAHDVTAKLVEEGKMDAGALSKDVWDKLVREKKVDTTKVKVFWTTPPFHDYNWTVRKDLDKELVNKIITLMTSLDSKNPEHKEVLDLMRAKKFIPTKPANYKEINDAALAAGLLK